MIDARWLNRNQGKTALILGKLLNSCCDTSYGKKHLLLQVTPSSNIKHQLWKECLLILMY